MDKNNIVTEENLTINDFERVCRTCLSIVDLKPISDVFDLAYFPVEIALNKYTQVQIDPTDNLPKHICSSCVKNLNNSYDFLLNCDLVNTTLKECLSRYERNLLTNIYVPKDIEYVNCQIKQDPADFDSAEVEPTEQSVVLTHDGIERVDIKEEVPDNSEDENDSDNYEPDGEPIITNVKQTRRETFKGTSEEREMQLDMNRIHSGGKSYTCEVCSRTFIRTEILKRHMKTHFGERPYTCEVCSKAFTVSKSLKHHMRIHSGEKPYACKLCSKAFAQSSDLKNHTRTHTGEKPFCCGICGSSFSTNGNLTIHKRSHTGERPYICPFCGKGFRDSGKLKRHKRIHGDQNLGPPF